MAYFVDGVSLSRAPAFVNADFVGFETKVPDLDRRAAINRTLRTGDQILGDDTPRLLKFTRKRDKLPDIFVTHLGAHVVSSRLAALIERFDPGLHQLIPLETLRGPENDLQRYILNIHHSLDGVVDQMSDVGLIQHTGGKLQITKYPPRLTLSLEVPKVLSLWRDRRLMPGFFLSDALYDAMKSVGIKFFRDIYKTTEPLLN